MNFRRNLLFPVLLLRENIIYETMSEGLKESGNFVKYQEAKNVGESALHTSTFFWKLVAVWPPLRPCSHV